MEVDVTQGDGCRRTLRINLTAAEVSETHGEVASQYTGSVSLPGFRPGKAPRKLVLKRYEKQITQEVQDRILPKAYREALGEKELKVAQVVSASEVKIVEGEPLTLTIELDVQPDIDLPEYKGLSLKDETQVVDDAAVEEMIERLRQSKGNYDDAEEGAELAASDLAQIDYTGTLDGAPVSEVEGAPATFGSGEDFWMQTGPEAFLPEIGEGMVGSVAGDTRTIEVTFPETAPEGLAGKTASYEVALKAIRTQTLPDLTDELAKEFGVDTMDLLRTEIRSDLEGQAERAELGRRGDSAIQQVLEAVTFDVPASEVDSETRQAVHELVESNTRRGVDRSEIEENKGELFQAAQKQAEERIKVQYLAKTIADAEKIEVTQDELKQEMSRLAMQYQMKLEEIMEHMKDPAQLEKLHRSITVRKVIDFLVEQANVA